MGTYVKRITRRGDTRWTAMVRKQGHIEVKTFGTKQAAQTWVRATEHFIETGKYITTDRSGMLFADCVDDFLAHRAKINRPLGKTAQLTLLRLKAQHGLENVNGLDAAFWRKHGLQRMADDKVGGATVSGDLAYAGSVMKHADRQGHKVIADGPAKARAMLQDDNIPMASKQRTKRLSDAELKRLFDWIAANESRTALPLADLVAFALATALRRNEMLSLKWSDVNMAERVMHVHRKHPRERDRIEKVSLLIKSKTWPRVDPLAILKRQKKTDDRIFPYIGDTVSYWFEQACEGAKVDDCVWHLLRHECLSRLAERGMDPLRLALIGGHRDLRNVKRYSKIDPSKLAFEK